MAVFARMTPVAVLLRLPYLGASAAALLVPPVQSPASLRPASPLPGSRSVSVLLQDAHGQRDYHCVWCRVGR